MDNSRPSNIRRIVIATVVVLTLLLGWRLARIVLGGPDSRADGPRRAPVAVAPIEHGPMALHRVFSGTLEALSSFTIAPKVGGRVESIFVDLGDAVERDQVVVQLDNAEFEQAVAEAEADLAVAQANLIEARSLAEIAQREVERFKTLRENGYASAQQFEAADAENLARQARLRVTEAQITRADATLAATRIRLSYARVRATWDGEDQRRLVAERFINVGDTVSANAPLLRIVDLDRLIAVIFVTEKDYSRLETGQEAAIRTDAHPGEVFTGAIIRIAPVFRETTRQARVELLVMNPDHRLNPGMFIRATLTLARVDDATHVPEAALTRRGEIDGVFVVDEAGTSARWVPVKIGMRDAGRVQLFGEGLNGRVIVLGQQLVDDGSPVTITDEPPAALAR